MSKQRNKYKVVYSYLWKTYGSSWLVRISFILQVLTRIMKLIAQPIALSLVITNLASQNFSEAQKFALYFIGSAILVGIMNPLIKLISMRGENPKYASATEFFFHKLILTDIEFFNSSLTGYLTTATRHFVDNGIKIVRSLRDTYISTILSILFPLGVILYVDATLGLISFLLSIALAAYLIWTSKLIDPLRKKSREFYKNNSGRMADIISNILAVKSSAQESVYAEQVKTGAHKESKAFSERYTLQAKLIGFREVITIIFFTALLWLSIHRLEIEKINLAQAILVITYIGTILSGIYSLSEQLDEHDDMVDKMLPALELIGRKNEIEDPLNPVQLTNVRGEIKIDNIHFSYHEQHVSSPVFSGFSLYIPAGQKLGVVGISGAGKSTLTKLLLRFQDVQKGQITLDGINIRQSRQQDLRKNIAYVPQEPQLFHASIKENLLLPKPLATEGELTHALKVAHAYNFVEALPEGLESIVGERGVKLSGGQKQRIAIARAVLQNAPIIILDEATSALDSESEQIIKSSFAEVFKGKTAIVVAHRLSTLSDMDRIVVIDNGKLVEDGTHEGLLKKDGLYSSLWQRQLHNLET